ncbi:DUF983 domain-containing protein [Palleronia sediminis]|uniref:DUF983 domain-containing protein n=1 Tax=Palleronia sediminis TaxID=2547833 RepID=A0A4R6AEK4_9RHOB|nr:DUF983 domain-containing protein [Palleronia sediminis]TDL79683.1 DUF983 domain-containing protein [Palleronia sediminis]
MSDHSAPQTRSVAEPQDDTADRPLRPALARGYRRQCPNCGAGPLLRGYLTLRRTCTVCGEDLSHARADDGPAYVTILIVGHLMAPFLHIVFVRFRPEPIVLATIFCIGCVGLSLYLLPRIKGMMVGFQWARRMHGF